MESPTKLLLAPSPTGDREAEDFPDSQATHGLQIEQEPGPKDGRPIDQFIDSVAVETRPQGWFRDAGSSMCSA